MVVGERRGGGTDSGEAHLELADEEEGHESHCSVFSEGVEVDL